MASRPQTDLPRIFISYSRQDAAIMKQLEKRLRAAGAEVWVDHAGIRSGDNLPKRISDALEWCNILLLLWSTAAQRSKWVEKEWTNAEALERRIIPCLLDSTPLPGILASKVYVDFGAVDEGLTELLHSLDLSEPTLMYKTRQREPHIGHGRFARGKLEDKLLSQGVLRLRSQQVLNLSMLDVKKMLKEEDFFDTSDNIKSNGLRHTYQMIERHGQKLVFDGATGLTWQQSGSIDSCALNDAEQHIQELNQQRFGGYADWRLPTLEEAMSLMEPTKSNDDLHIDRVFDKTQSWIWTADKDNEDDAWVVSFYRGSYSYYYNTLINHYVRAVRSGQSGLFDHSSHLILFFCLTS